MTSILTRIADFLAGRRSPPGGSTEVVDVLIAIDGRNLRLKVSPARPPGAGEWSGYVARQWESPPPNGRYEATLRNAAGDVALSFGPMEWPRRHRVLSEGDRGTVNSHDLVVPWQAHHFLMTQARAGGGLRGAMLRITVDVEAYVEEPVGSGDVTDPVRTDDPITYVPTQDENESAARLAGLGYVLATEDRNTIPRTPDVTPPAETVSVAKPVEPPAGFVTGGGDGLPVSGSRADAAEAFVTGGGDGRDDGPTGATTSHATGGGDGWTPGDGGYGR